MKKVLFLLIYLAVPIISHAQIISGRIINDMMENLSGADIINHRTNHKSITDNNGIYHIDAIVGDTLEIHFIGYSKEIRSVINLSERINVLLMDKRVNDLGAIWTKKQWAKANKQIQEKYKELENKAKRVGKWNY